MSAPQSAHLDHRAALDQLGRALVAALASAAERRSLADPAAEDDAARTDQGRVGAEVR